MGQSFLRGSAFLGSANWFSSIINFALGLLLARLLGPSIFGLYAFAFAINEFVNLVAAFGIATAVLQAREESQEIYDSAYMVSALLGGAGLVISLILAPIVGAEHSAEAGWLLVGFGVFRIFTMLAQLHTARMERQLRYGALAAIGLATSNLPLLVALAGAWAGLGIWSLLLRDGLTALIFFSATLLASGYRFQGRFQREALSRLMKFSAALFAARAVEVTLSRVDRLVVSSFAGDRILGLYHQAMTLSETGITVLRPIYQVTFNLFSRLQDDPRRLARSYELATFVISRLSVGGGLVLFLAPEQTIRLLLGEEWMGASPMLHWLGIYGALLPIDGNMKQMLIARGKLAALTKIRLAQLVVLACCLTAATRLGSIQLVVGSIVGVWSLSTLLCLIANFRVGGRAILQALIAPLLSALGAALAIHWGGGGGLARRPPLLERDLPAPRHLRAPPRGRGGAEAGLGVPLSARADARDELKPATAATPEVR